MGVLFLIYLPFLGLIRSGIYFYHAYNFNTWIGLFLGVVFSVGVIAVYTFTIKKLMNRNSKMRWKTTKKVGVFIFLLVISYVIFSLLSFSGKNAQSNKVKSEYSELHPYLKISVRTFLFFDNELIITDLSRTSDDYTKMGLKKKDSSLHFIQNTGYTHAMDLRTRDRPFWMIWSAQLYFKSLGFNAVRHGGTGDHLHVSLSTYEKQRSW